MSDRAHTVKTAVYPGNVFRFCVHSSPRDDFPDGPILEKGVSFEPTTLHADSQGILRMKRRNLQFLFEPPTGNFKLSCDDCEILNGRMQTGEQDRRFLFIRLQPGDSIHGFGAAVTRPDCNNQDFRLLNRGALASQNGSTPPRETGFPRSSFPFFIIRRKKTFRGVFLNSTLPLDVHADNDGRRPEGPGVCFEIQGGYSRTELDVFLFHGSLPEILDNYTKITGRPFRPPAWALGYHLALHCKNQQGVLELAQRLREENIPCDALHLDVQYMDSFRVFTWNRQKFENPERMNKELEQLGIRTVAVLEPSVMIEDGYKIYQQGKDGRFYCKNGDGDDYVGRGLMGKAVFPDFTRETVRDWWADCHQELFRSGVSGIWNDGNEPVLKIGKRYNPLDEDITHATGTHEELRNIYANLEARATVRGFAKSLPGSRPFVLSSSGFCGIQKESALYIGNDRPSWERLKENLNGILNLGLSGAPFVGADTGGYSMKRGFGDALRMTANRELFVRSIELGSLMPFFRVHLASLPGPWKFGLDALAAVLKHVRRRYRLLPYIYNLIQESCETGAPPARPVFYDFPDIDDERALQDQFMLGPHLLAAPALEEGQKTRRVFLPPGDWYEFETGRCHAGNAECSFATQPGFYPLFVRGGAVIPFCRPLADARQSLLSDIVLEIYPADEMSGRLFLDDCLTAREERFIQEYRAARDRSGNITLDLTVVQSDFTPSFQDISVRLPLNYRYMMLNNEKIEGKLENLVLEDRVFEMYSFRLPLSAERAEFPFKSSWEF